MYYKTLEEEIISYFSIIIIILGCIGNTISFLIFCFNKDMKKMSSMMILSFISVFDTISLFGWNLDHFARNFSAKSIFYQSLFNCRFLVFLQFWSMQSRGFLVSLLSVDRYFLISSRPGSLGRGSLFGKPKTAFIQSMIIIILTMFLNAHILVLNGWNELRVISNSTSKYILHCFTYKNGFKLSDYEKLNIVLYCAVPFVLMLTFNTLIIKKIYSNRTNRVDDSAKIKSNSSHLFNRKRLSTALIVISFSYIIMTAPAVIIYFFLNKEDEYYELITILFDDLSFLNNISVFFICYITIFKFRKVFNDKLKTIFNLII
jgi:hypothetical protein